MYKKLVHDIETVLHQQIVLREEIVELAHEYSEACETVNLRAEVVVQLLNQGYRNEAIEYGEQNPVLLDLIHQLDFNNFPDWQQRLEEEELPKSNSVNRGAGELIEDAYDELRKLENVLKKNRILALSQAPLAARLRVLREIAKLDPVNPIWIMDMENLERTRIEQIQAEYAMAKKKEDVETLQRLDEELAQPWEIAVPKSLKAKVTSGNQGVAALHAKRRMEEINIALNECLASYDSARAFALRQEWEEENEIAQLDADDPVFLDAVEPLAWLDDETESQLEQGEFDKALKILENAIDNKCPLSELEQHIYSVQKFDRETPPALVQRVASYRRQIETGQRRSFITKAVAVVLVIALLAAGAYWLISAQQARSRLAETVQQLEALTDNYSAASSYYAQLPEPLKQNSQVTALWSTIETKNEQKTSQNQEFQQLSGQFNLEGELDYKLDALVDKMEGLADDPQEKTKVDEFRKALSNEQAKRYNQRNKAFSGELKKISDQLANTQNQPNSQALEKLAAEVDLLIAENKGRTDGRSTISPENYQLANEVSLKIGTSTARMEKLGRAEDFLSKLPSAESNLGQFADALNNFSSQFPEHPYASDFKMVGQEKALWQELEQWQLLARQSEWTNVTKLDQQDAGSLLDSITDLKTNSHKIWMEDDTKDIEALLTRLGDPDQVTREELKENIFDYLNNELLLRYQEWVVVGDKFYYLPDKLPKHNGKTVGVVHYLDVDDLDLTDRFRVEKDKITYEGLAGHCEVSKELTALDPDTFSSIDEYGLALAKVALLSQAQGVNQADLIPRTLILEFVLGECSNASIALEDKYDKWNGALKRLNLLQANWFEPDNAQANQKRVELRTIVLPRIKIELDQLTSEMKNRDSKLSQELAWRDVADLACIGWLEKIDGGEWSLETGVKSETAMDVMAIVPKESEVGSAELIKVGKLLPNGSLEIKNNSQCKVGRPLFAVKKTESK